jgi:hypothetical protein
MSDFFNVTNLLILIGCLCIGALYAWLLYRSNTLLSKKLIYVLAALRTVFVAVIVWILFSPLLKQVLYTLEKPIIIIGQDNSRSVNKAPGNFNRSQYETNMKTLAGELSKKYDVRVYNFSDQVKQGYDFSNQGKVTNVSSFLSQIKDGFLNKNVGAVVIATDGIFNRGGNPLYDVAALKSPVYTIALGDTIPKRDVLIANLNYNNLVYLDNDFTVEVQVQAYQSKGAATVLSVTENGKKIHSEQLSLSSNPFAKNITVKIKATTLGIHKYSVSLSSLDNEASVSNNIQSFLVEVIDDRQKVLIAAAGPHPDISALKQAIEVNKHYEVKVALKDDLNTIKPKDYSLIILYQLPGLNESGGSALQQIIAGGTSLWYILGAQSDLSGFNRIQKQVSWNGGSSNIVEAYSRVNTAFTAFNVSEQDQKVIGQYDALQVPEGSVNVNGNAAVLLYKQAGKVSTNVPQLFFNVESGKKIGYLIGEGLWRWKLSESRSGTSTGVFYPLISNIVQYLSVKDDKQKFKVYPSKSAFDENENVILNATLYNDSYVAVNTPEVNALITDGKGKIYNYLFSKTESAYQLDAGALTPGDYTYVANTTLGDKKYTVKGAFFVNALVAEDQQTIANHQILYSLSAQTNGKLYLPQNLMDLVKDLEKNEQIKTVSYEDRKFQQLIDFKWLFFIIMGLISAEWFLRKRNGEL